MIVIPLCILLVGTIPARTLTLDNKPMILWIAYKEVAPWFLKVRVFLPELLAAASAFALAFLILKSPRLVIPVLAMVIYLAVVRAFSHVLLIENFNSIRLMDFAFYPLLGFYLGVILKFCIITKQDFDLFWKSVLLNLVWQGFFSLPGPSYFQPGTLPQTIGFIFSLVLYPLMVGSALALPLNTYRIIFKRQV